MPVEKKGREEELKAVGKKLEYWRAHREKRGPIPPGIMRDLHPLTQFYPLSWLTEVLHINYRTLKKAMRGTSPEVTPLALLKKTIEPTPFVKISPCERSVSMKTIEIETPQGYKTRFTTAFDPTPHIERLLKSLFEFPR